MNYGAVPLVDSLERNDMKSFEVNQTMTNNPIVTQKERKEN